MMGRQGGDQRQLFYLFNLEDRIPAEHLLSRINPIVTAVLGDLRDKLVSFYSDIGRPSIDPELMMRMLIVGYCYGNCRSSCLQARRRVPRAFGTPASLAQQANDLQFCGVGSAPGPTRSKPSNNLWDSFGASFLLVLA